MVDAIFQSLALAPSQAAEIVPVPVARCWIVSLIEPEREEGKLKERKEE